MLDPLAVEERFQGVIESLSCNSSERIQLMRIVEFLEVLLETQSKDLILKYAPILLGRLARVVGNMRFTDDNIGVVDRLTPILWSFVFEYATVGNPGICLSMLNSLSEAKTRVELGK